MQKPLSKDENQIQPNYAANQARGLNMGHMSGRSKCSPFSLSRELAEYPSIVTSPQSQRFIKFVNRLEITMFDPAAVHI